MSEITVLIVDDEPGNIDLIRGLLPENCRVKAATSGMLACKIAGKQLPDVVLLDNLMPGMSGPETAKQLRGLPGGDSVKIIYVSGSELSSDINPEDGFLLKPVEKAQLDQLLTSFV